jgi:hypothetical protein
LLAFRICVEPAPLRKHSPIRGGTKTMCLPTMRLKRLPHQRSALVGQEIEGNVAHRLVFTGVLDFGGVAVRQGQKGVMAKHLASRYLPGKGRSSKWPTQCLMRSGLQA